MTTRSTTLPRATTRFFRLFFNPLESRFVLWAFRTALYAVRSHGFRGDRGWGECAHSNRDSAIAVSFSPLRRELSRSHEYRLRDAGDERRPRSERLGLRHRERNFLHWIFRAPNSRGATGRAVERAALTRAHPDYLGRTHNPDRVCPHSAP